MLYLLPEPAALGENFWEAALAALPDERRGKVLRYRFAKDRVLSAAAFLLFRFALDAEYGMFSPPAWQYGPFGKPFLCGGPCFSLSHCARGVACAVDGRDVGVDVEHAESFIGMDGTLEASIFSPAELEKLRQAPDRPAAACALWVAKESVCKYTGEGLRDLPSALCRTDVQIDLRTIGGLSVAVCRGPGCPPLPCRTVTPQELTTFLGRCLWKVV